MPGTRTSPHIKTKRRARTSNNGKPETPSARAKRKRKAATTRAKPAAGNKRAKPTKSTGVQEIPDEYAEEPNPEEVIEKNHEHTHCSSSWYEEETKCAKKAVVKGRGCETIEEINDDSTYLDDEVNKEEDESVNSEDGKEKHGADNNDNNFALNKLSSDNDDGAESGRTERFERDIANTDAEVELVARS